LCGGFNSSIAKAANAKINSLVAAGKDVKIICIGRKGYDSLKRTHKKRIVEVVEDLGKKVEYSLAESIANKIIESFNKGEFDVCTFYFNKFQSAISQKVIDKQLVPLELPENDNAGSEAKAEFEPSEEQILESLLPKNLAVQLYSGLLENLASEQGARMTAMDNATRNAGEMIKKLTLIYNRNRQAAITKELIEIISGAEAI
jgi:F-type H+-transporting ATPase subunit gamma